MDENSDVVCPWCGSAIIWQQDPPDISGVPGEKYPVDCTGRCEQKDGSWLPIPRAEYVD